MNSGLRVESLANSLKEVQTAKSCLEERLNVRRNKRRNAESVLESVNMKLSEVKDLHTKMMETMKLAQHKVTQSQALSDSIEGNYQDKRKLSQKMANQMKDVNESRTSDTQKFQDELSRLSRLLIEAKDLYAENKVKEKIEESDRSVEEMLKDGDTLDENMSNAVNHLAAININNSNSSIDHCEDIDKENIWNIVDEEQRSTLQYLQSLNEEIEAAKMLATDMAHHRAKDNEESSCGIRG